MSYKDDVKIFLNIMAQSPDGLGDPQLIGKFSKAKAQLHALDSYSQLQAMNNAPQTSNQPLQSTIAPQTDGSATPNPQEPLGVNTAQDTGIPPQEPTQ